MAGDLRIRMAAPEDAVALARLRFAFRSEMNAAIEPEDAFVARCAAWMRPRLEAPGAWRCWMAESAAGIEGNIWLQLIEKLPNPVSELELHGYITNVFVRPEARGAGAGALLLEAALGHCREQDVDSVILWPSERSRQLYARHGFAVRDDLMEAILDPGRDLH
ncbi:MAG: GNAT family N-acetyltransferase [Chloroflexi bacterium]|nr:GNAT family N-acetyltransferase [Chloroflexota bacterium]